jgi:hypothetical protein
VIRILKTLPAFSLQFSVSVILVFVVWQGSRPLSTSGAIPAESAFSDLSYWQYLGDRLRANAATPPECRNTRLVFLAIAVPLYPAIYTLAGLYPESGLARHVAPDPRRPARVAWRQAPETWWRLVVEFTWMAFTQPQWDFSPGMGERVRADYRCILPPIFD